VDKTIIYGASDDQILIEGGISEQFDVYGDHNEGAISCSDGSLFKYIYNEDAEWVFRIIKKGSSKFKIINSVGEDSKHEGEFEKISPYSDIIVFEENIEWVALCTSIAKRS